MGQSRARVQGVRRKQPGRRRDWATAGEGKAAEQVRQGGEQCGARAGRGKMLRGRTVWPTGGALSCGFCGISVYISIFFRFFSFMDFF